MTPDRWERVKEIVYGALELEPEARAPFLARECGEDDDLRREIDSLLETHGHGEAFLATLDGPAEARPASDVRGAARPPRVCPECGVRYDDPPTFCPADGAPLVEDPRDRVGTTLDGLYAIEALVGEGGMGAVYRARHVILGDPVAIKVVRGDFAASPDLLKRFRREGQAARRFKHPNAVTVHDLRTASDGTTYMVLEYVDGRTLRAELDARKALPLDEVVELVGQLASALDAAHAAGVVHRDLKPENVMLAHEEGRPLAKLLDLGIAKVGSPRDGVGATAITTPGQIMGTPAYMSPEQWGAPQRDGVDEVDGRSDVYSLGVVVYEAVSGRRPITGKTFRDFERGHVTGAPERLDRVVVVPPAFAAAVASALAKDRADRPATPGALAASLRAVVEASALPTESLPAPTARVRSRRAPIAAAVAVAVAAIVAIAWAVAARRPNEAAVPPAPRAPETSAVAAAPALAYAVEVERTPRGETARVAEASVRPRQAFKFRFSPAEPGYLYIVYPGEGGVPTTLLTAKPAAATGVATNRAEAGVEVEFPRTADFWLAVRDDAPVTRFTVIFSPELLAEPAFLAERAGRPLTAPEQTALDRFREERAADARTDGDRVVVTRPGGAAPRAPLVFDIPVALATTP